MYLTSDDFGNLLQSGSNEKDEDFQLWLINSENGLIQNKRTGMYLTTSFDGIVKTSENLPENFNKWKLLLPNETYTVNSKTINTPIGRLELIEDYIHSKFISNWCSSIYFKF